MKDSDRYPLTVFWSQEDGAFIAEARDLPGCSAVGDSREEAVQEARDAIETWIEAAQAAGNPVPEPSSAAPEHAYSGKLLLRMPRSLHAQLARDASTEGVSLNQWVVHLLSSKRTDPHGKWLSIDLASSLNLIVGRYSHQQVEFSSGSLQQLEVSSASSPMRGITATHRAPFVN